METRSNHNAGQSAADHGPFHLGNQRSSSGGSHCGRHEHLLHPGIRLHWRRMDHDAHQHSFNPSDLHRAGSRSLASRHGDRFERTDVPKNRAVDQLAGLRRIPIYGRLGFCPALGQESRRKRFHRTVFPPGCQRYSARKRKSDAIFRPDLRCRIHDPARSANGRTK